MLPAIPGVGREKYVPAQPGDPGTAVVTVHTEQAALITQVEQFPAHTGIPGSHYQAELPHHQQGVVRDRADAIEVQKLGIGQAGGAVLPGDAAIAGHEKVIESADGKTMLFVSKPDIQERAVGADFLLAQGLVHGHHRRILQHHQFVGIHAIGRCRFQLGIPGLRGRQQFVTGVATVQLARPGFTAIGGVQDHRIVAHSPAFFGSRKMHRRQGHLHRHMGLAPALAAIVGIQHGAVLADRDQAIACRGYIEQQGTERTLIGLGGQVKEIGEAGSAGRNAQAPKQTEQQPAHHDGITSRPSCGCWQG